MLDATAETGLLDRLGPRAVRRPSPRVGVTMAAVGSALVVVAVLAESGQRLADSAGGSPNRWPGLVLSAIVLAAGFALIVRFPRGPIATAGVAATALATPVLLFFLTVDFESVPPFSADVILALATAAWVAFYVLGPARAHGFYLGAALFGLWLFVLEESEHVFSFPFALPALVFRSEFNPDRPRIGAHIPSVTNVGTISLLFGAGYLIATWMLDRRDRRGLATPFTVAGLVALSSGIVLLANDLEEVGTGLLLVVAGLAVAVIGASAERRATTWIGGVGVFIGAIVLAGKVANDNVDAFAIVLALFGAIAVVGGHRIHVDLGEPDETVAGPSSFTREPPSPPTPF